jgi:hypothetical protein
MHGAALPCAINTSIWRSSVTICSALNLFFGMTQGPFQTLDPMPSQRAFLTAASRVSDPMLVIYGATTPARSKAEIEALTCLPNVQSHELPAGKLSVHEEFSTPVAELVRAFIN